MATLRLNRGEFKATRQIKGYNVPALAKALDVTPDHLYRIEYGKRNPSPALYKSMIELLRLEEGDLLLDDSEDDEAEAGAA